jgi:pyridoxine/pyridoxamine 5'-phosphate oxidase
MTLPFAEYLPPFLKAMHIVNRELHYWQNTRSRLADVIPVTAEWISLME